MEELRVLVALRMDREQLGEIAAVDPRVRVEYVAEEFIALLGPAARWVPALGENPAVDRAAAEARLASSLREAEVIYAIRVLPDLKARSPRLRWVHLVPHGIDHIRGDILEGEVIITTGQGSHDIAVAEHVMALILMLAKRAPLLFEQQRHHRWERIYTMELAGRTLGLVGLGSIGRRVAGYAHAFGMRVIATKRTPSQDLPYGVEELVPVERLEYLLGQSDFVVLALPLTPSTRNFIGERELKAMKPTAYLINIARGGVVDEAALLRALREGWIAGAGLDVFQTEPLPPESPFWDMDNVILTPHIGGLSHRFVEHANRLFCENLRRYIRGEPLLNILDLSRGY